MKSVLEFDSLELSYETRTILSDIYIKCEGGEIIGVLGRNGSGKSSMMKIVFGSMKGSHQSIRINGESLSPNHLSKKLIGYLPQESLMPSFISIRKAFRLFGINEDEVIADFPEIKDFLLFTSKQLSGGYQRIVEAMLILKSRAPFCILDEPFSGLMPAHIERLKKIIVNEKTKKGIILTDHMYRHVISVTDRLYLLVNGKTYPVADEDDLVRRGYLT
jgi:ABC-type multidrug transport system ATPase subunit